MANLDILDLLALNILAWFQLMNWRVTVWRSIQRKVYTAHRKKLWGTTTQLLCYISDFVIKSPSLTTAASDLKPNSNPLTASSISSETDRVIPPSTKALDSKYDGQRQAEPPAVEPVVHTYTFAYTKDSRPRSSIWQSILQDCSRWPLVLLAYTLTCGNGARGLHFRKRSKVLHCEVYYYGLLAPWRDCLLAMTDRVVYFLRFYGDFDGRSMEFAHSK